MKEQNVTVVDQVWAVVNKTNQLVQSVVREVFNGKTSQAELILQNSEGPDYKVTVKTTKVRATKNTKATTRRKTKVKATTRKRKTSRRKTA